MNKNRNNLLVKMMMRQPTSTEEGKEAPVVEGEGDEENQEDLGMPALPTYAYVCIRVSTFNQLNKLQLKLADAPCVQYNSFDVIMLANQRVMMLK
jgi:hypothetical protein